MRLRPLPLAAALALLLSGCASPADPAAGEGESVTLVTDPSQGRMDPAAGPHLHDYWGSATERSVLDASFEAPGYQWTGDSLVVAEFRPEAGDVVPQGAASVRVALDWTDDDPMNRFSGAELWVKTAADSEPWRVGPIAPGDAVEIPSTNERNDLPHQVLSAWVVQLVLLADTSLVQTLVMYSGTVTAEATAVRGLDIPLYPGHPDQWEGRTEIQLVDHAGDARYFGDGTSDAWSCFGGDCTYRIAPVDGAVVPIDADHVTITLTREAGTNPLRLGVKAHSAITRDFTEPEDKVRDDLVTTYTIPVGDGGDGAYAQQSQWEFAVVVDEPRDDGFVFEQYHLAVTVHKDP